MDGVRMEVVQNNSFVARRGEQGGSVTWRRALNGPSPGPSRLVKLHRESGRRGHVPQYICMVNALASWGSASRGSVTVRGTLSGRVASIRVPSEEPLSPMLGRHHSLLIDRAQP